MSSLSSIIIKKNPVESALLFKTWDFLHFSLLLGVLLLANKLFYEDKSARIGNWPLLFRYCVHVPFLTF